MSEQEENRVEEASKEIDELTTSDDQNSDAEVKIDKQNVVKQSSNNVETKADEEAASISRIPPTLVKEKPKINYKKNNDDIEEFDTDEEEEEEEEEKEKTVDENYTKNITYEGDKCIYIEPGTGRRLTWNSKENKWCPEEENEDPANPMKNYEFDGKNYVYTDKTTNVTYKFIQEKNEWVVKDKNENEADEGKGDEIAKPPAVQGTYGFENDTHTYTDPTDGTSYFWDKEKNAWFPKIDDDFMARYQMSYGFTDSSNAKPTPDEVPKQPPQPPEKPKKLSKEEKKAENKRKAQEPPTWFEVEEKHNTTVYISNLPLDVTMDELKELVCKCGLLARDDKGNDKIKLYVDSDGELKGDARCTYIKVESVDLALNIINGWNIRGKTLSVERAKFEMKGTYDPTKKPKRKKKDKEKQKKIHQKLFDWRPDKILGEPLKHERVVIIKNLFQPTDFDKDVKLILEYQQDVRSECEKCGEIKKVTIYDQHPEGVAQVTFKEVEEAQACIELLNGRWFGQRRITAEIWDGKTKYKIKETEEQIEARIDKWNKFLEQEDDTDSQNTTKKNTETETKKDTHSEATSSTTTA